MLVFQHATISKNRRFNQTKEIPPYNESIITIKIADFNNWKITRNKSGQYLFSQTVSDLGGTYKDIQIHLPQIELARVLFSIMLIYLRQL